LARRRAPGAPRPAPCWLARRRCETATSGKNQSREVTWWQRTRNPTTEAEEKPTPFHGAVFRGRRKAAAFRRCSGVPRHLRDQWSDANLSADGFSIACLDRGPGRRIERRLFPRVHPCEGRLVAWKPRDGVGRWVIISAC